MGKNSILRQIDVKSRNFHIFTSQIRKNTFGFRLWAQTKSIFVKQVNKFRDFRP